MKQQTSSKSCLHKKLQRPAACKGSPVIQVEPVQSAHLCFLSNHLHRLEQSALPLGKNCQGLALPLPVDFDGDGDGARTKAWSDIQLASMRQNPEVLNSKLRPQVLKGVLSCIHGLVECQSDC